jgi:peptidoglycan/LPS O-acetylase OafA/YrhL
MDSLFLGVLLAVLFRGEEGGGWLRTVVNSRYWVLVSMLALIPFYFYSPLYRSVPAIFGYTIFAFFYAGLLIHAVARDGSPPNRLCRIRSLQRTGRLAYGIYLFHMPVLGLLFAISRNTLPNMETPAALGLVCVALAITLLLADFSFRLLEQPLIRYGHRWRYAKAEADPPEPG